MEKLYTSERRKEKSHAHFITEIKNCLLMKRISQLFVSALSFQLYIHGCKSSKIAKAIFLINDLPD